MNAVVESITHPIAVAGVESLLARAIEKGLDTESLQKLVELQERVMDKQAAMDFAVAMQQVQRAIPAVKRNKANDQTQSRYATLEALNKAIVPIYTQHGFSLSFGTEDSKIEGYLRIVCDCSHIGGCIRRYHFDLPLDDVGIKGSVNKTRVHASGSTLSYGRRYLTMLIFNVSTTDDDDGNGADGSQLVTEDQAMTLKALAEDVGADVPKFCTWFKVDGLGSIKAKDYKLAVQTLERKRVKP